MLKDFIIPAAEANKKTKQTLNSIISDELSSIKIEIEKAINDGKYEAFMYKSVSVYAQKVLIDLGYVIDDYSSQKDGDCYKISWKNEKEDERG